MAVITERQAACDLERHNATYDSASPPINWGAGVTGTSGNTYGRWLRMEARQIVTVVTETVSVPVGGNYVY